MEFKRTWPIAPDEGTLRRRWRALLHAPDRAKAFAESSDRLISQSYASVRPKTQRDPPIAQLSQRAHQPRLERYSYRSFDVQVAFIDARLCARARPDLWRAHSDRQVHLTTLLNHPLGPGPALTACAYVPDLYHFRGSFGAREVTPRYRDAAAQEPNVAPGLLESLSTTLGRIISSEDFAACVYAVLAHPGFTERFWTQLETRQLRVPLTKDLALFEQAVEIGRRLLWLHTFGARFYSRRRDLPPRSFREYLDRARTGRNATTASFSPRPTGRSPG